MEVHNAKVICGRNSPGSHLLDPVFSFPAEGAWPEEGYVRFGKVYHGNARRPGLNFSGASQRFNRRKFTVHFFRVRPGDAVRPVLHHR